jgi:two-component sensor histidine kinase
MLEPLTATPPASALKGPPEPVALLLVAEIEHRVANVLTAALSAVSLASKRGSTRADLLEETARRLGGHADLHRILQSPSVSGSVDFREHVTRIAEAAARAGLGGVPVRVALGARPIEVDGWRCWLAGLIVTELIINAGRHGSIVGKGAVSIGALAQGPDVMCRVASGAPMEAWRSAGRGSGIVDNLAAALEGRVQRAVTETGVAVTLSFPMLGPAGAKKDDCRTSFDHLSDGSTSDPRDDWNHDVG